MQILFAYLVCLIIVTFFDFRVYLTSWHFSANIVPFTETIAMIQGARLSTSLLNILGNLVLLAPLGFLLPIINREFRSFKKVAITGFLVSLSIESMQFVMMVRLFDVDDLLFNSLGAVFGYLIYLLAVKHKLLKVIQAKVENQYHQKIWRMITLSIISLFLVFASFWIYGYAKETYSAAGDAQNSVYQFVVGKEIKKYSDDRYLVVISEASENSSTKNVNIFVKTPFNRAVPYISSDIPATNFYGNAFNYSGNSTIDDKMFCILYGFNKTGDYVAIETGGKEYKKQIEQGYFVITVLADIIGDAKVSFYDSDGTDISIQFEPMTGTLDSQQ